MNKKSKIIASVTGIFLVLLILVGLTYAYFLTRINGNSNNKSISVTTDKLELTYGDGNGVLEPYGLIEPGQDVHFTDEGGHEVSSKTFTVTNNGNDTNYVVIIDNVSIKYLSNVAGHIAGTATTFTQSNFSYNLTCVSKNKETSVVTGTCDGVQDGIFPFVSKSILVSNDIAKDIVHEYTLTMHYVDSGELQNEDMDKGFEAQINIADIRSLNPYTEGTLAYNIINNSISGTNGTELRANPLTIPAVNISTADEKELSVTSDDYGTSYYYRGGVEDNYVNFAGMCWRAVRIAGDGSIKLILEDQDSTCATSDGNWNIPTTTGVQQKQVILDIHNMQ